MKQQYLEKSLVQQAKKYYSNKNYTAALKIYKQLSRVLGRHFFNYNIQLCQKNIDNEIILSVVIPTYNVEKYIPRALDSILSQTVKNIEIIIYDDCSDDNTIELIEKYREKNKNIKLIKSKKNNGQGKGRNEAIKLVSGRFTTFLDADDYYIDNEYFEKLLYLASIKNVEVVVTPYLREKSGVFKHDTFSEEEITGKEAAAKFISRKFGTHGPCGKLFTTGLIRNIKFVEYGYSQDVLFSLRAFLQARSVYAANIHGYVYYNDNISSWRPKKLTDRHFFSSIRVFIEVLYEAMYLRAKDEYLDINEFIRLWKRDHEPRMIKYVNQHPNNEVVKEIVQSLGHGLGFVLSAISSPELKKIFVDYYAEQKTSSKKVFDQEYISYLNYKLEKIKSLTQDYANTKKINYKKEKIVIYLSHLSSGGLEKVAIQLGKSLFPFYDIIYMLDNNHKISYEYVGDIVKTNLLEIDVIEMLQNAAFIFDFKFKALDAEFPICLYCLAKYSDKYIATIHNTKTCKNYFEKSKYYLQRKSIDSLYSVLCVSGMVRKKFEELYGSSKKVVVIYNPVDFAKIKLAKPVVSFKEEFILFAGRLNATQHKGIDILLKAYAQSQTKRKCLLLLAGNGKLEPELEEFINDYDLSKKVHILGFQENIYGYMKQALFLVAPSRWEGFSMSIIESLACGTPVLTTAVGGAPEIIQHKKNGFFVNLEDINDTAHGIDYMYTHAYTMKTFCRDSVKKLSIQHYQTNILKLLHKNKI